MEVTRGNGYAPAWGSLVMMMMMINSALTGSAWLQLSRSVVASQCGVGLVTMINKSRVRLLAVHVGLVDGWVTVCERVNHLGI